MTDNISKKEKIIIAAIDLFVDRGFDKVATADISKSAGVATGTLFHHFSTKDDIIISSYVYAKRNFIAQTKTNETACDVREHLRRMWNNLIEWSLAHKNEFGFIQQFVNSAYYKKQIMQEDDTWLELLHWWKVAILNKQIKDVPVEFLIKMFSTLLYSTIDFLIHNPQEKEKYFQVSFALCWDMVRINTDETK
ncbi:TetR/AcrR family transcriptional regulator [Pedobacter sp. WC2423]|uniref:TetR/AcrR family transcriptional regulator n=1 Tax=Pedobacter sp. WC2423 TaxID=3234142 RepID=UPI0034663DD4